MRRYFSHLLARLLRDSQQHRPAPLPINSEATSSAPPKMRLDPAYTRTEQWQTSRSDLAELDLTSNEIFQLWQAIPYGHKWTHYFEIYQSVFGSRRQMPMRIFEIGVNKGASLRLWKSYFTNPQTLIVGLDIDPACSVYDAPELGIHVRIGSQADLNLLAALTDEFGPFDLIIDDGSHRSSDLITSFNGLYANGLKDDGIYFAEDLHANYWVPFRDSANSFLDFCKDLVELMHAHYWNTLLTAWSEELEANKPISLQVPEITKMIREIRFFDSSVAIYKMRRQHVPRYLMPAATVAP